MHNLLDKYKTFIQYFLSIVIIIILAVVSIAYAKKQHIFLVRNIEIKGQNEVSELEILGRCNIQRGMNIFETDFVTNTHLLREHPYIWNARINTVLPDKIQIEISERQAKALLNLENIYALDKFATLLPPPSNSSKLPVITGIESTEHMQLSKKVIHPLIRDGLQMINIMNKRHPMVRKQITELHWEKQENSWIIILNASRKPLIYFGNTNLDDRLNILENYLAASLREAKNINKLAYIDLRFDGQVIER